MEIEPRLFLEVGGEVCGSAGLGAWDRVGTERTPSCPEGSWHSRGRGCPVWMHVAGGLQIVTQIGPQADFKGEVLVPLAFHLDSWRIGRVKGIHSFIH